MYIIFFNFAESCILSSMESLSFFLSYEQLKLQLRVFLAGHVVPIVTYCSTRLRATCSPMIGQFLDTMILASTDKEWLNLQ